jgi:hypothetical protein
MITDITTSNPAHFTTKKTPEQQQAFQLKKATKLALAGATEKAMTTFTSKDKLLTPTAATKAEFANKIHAEPYSPPPQDSNPQPTPNDNRQLTLDNDQPITIDINDVINAITPLPTSAAGPTA